MKTRDAYIPGAMSIRDALSVNRLIAFSGIRHMTSAKAMEAVPAKKNPIPITRLTASESFLPQYWLISTADPLCRPKMISCIMKMGVFATVTPAICSSPSMPTIKVSTIPRLVIIRFVEQLEAQAPRRVCRSRGPASCS